MPVTDTMDENDSPVVYSSNPKDYNKVTCLACMAVVKVHHMRKHMVAHGMTMAEYKEMYGTEFQYVNKVYHKCGICKRSMLFDLDTLYNHVSSFHQVKVKEYVDLYLGPIADMESAINNQTQPDPSSYENYAVDEDGAPIIGSSLKRSIEKTSEGFVKKSKLSNSNSHSVDAQNNLKVVSPDDAPEGQMLNCYKTNFIERIQERDGEGHLISNDFADYTLVECKICTTHLPMTRLRSHTKSQHKVTITEYKAQFGSDLVPIERVYHRCGICGELVLLDSDHIAVHLKGPGHFISHKNYNAGFMVDTRSSRSEVRSSGVFKDYLPSDYYQQKIKPKTEVSASERSRRKARVPYEETEYDLTTFMESPSPPPEEDDYESPIVVMENIEHDIFDTEDNKPPVIKSLQLSSTNKKLDVIMLDGLDDFADGDNKNKVVEEIVLDSDDEGDIAWQDDITNRKDEMPVREINSGNQDFNEKETEDASIGVFVDLLV